MQTLFWLHVVSQQSDPTRLMLLIPTDSNPLATISQLPVYCITMHQLALLMRST